jgi:hypothetical protein
MLQVCVIECSWALCSLGQVCHNSNASCSIMLGAVITSYYSENMTAYMSLTLCGQNKTNGKSCARTEYNR